MKLEAAGQPRFVAFKTCLYQAVLPFALLAFLVGCIPSSDSPGVASNVANLSGLEVTYSGQQPVGLSPAFDGNTTNYMGDVGGSVTTVNIKTTVPNPGNTTIRLQVPSGQTSTLVSGQNSNPLDVSPGANNFIVTVDAPGLTKAYTIVINRGSNANLQQLIISTGPTSSAGLDPAFAPATTAYTATTGFSTQSVSVIATLSDETSSLQVNGVAATSGQPSQSIALSSGQTTITILVLAQNNTSKAYTVVVTRAGTPDLGNLATSAGQISPAFASNTTIYTAAVPFGTSSATITPTAADTSATITISGPGFSPQPAASGAGFPVQLNVGDNAFTIVVTAQATPPTKTYTLTITRGQPSANSSLSSLTVNQGTLQPGFASTILGYTLDVANNVNSVTVSATPAESGASLTINGTPGSPQTVGLNPPGTATPIVIVVTAQNGGQTNYVITVTQTLSGNTNLSGLTVSPGSLSPGFNANTTSYSVDVESTVSSISVTATLQDTSSTLMVNGQGTNSGQARSIALGGAGSSTPFPIVVTAPNGTQKTYIVTVNRAALGGNNNLQSLSVSPGSLSPGFNSNTTNYNVDVASTVSSINVTATLQDTSATLTVNGLGTNSGQSRPITLQGPGSSTPFAIVVTAPNGTQKAYLVTVNRAALGGNNNLSGLTVSPGTLSPAFDTNTTSYNVDVASTVSSISVTATLQDTGATLMVNGQGTNSGQSRSITLQGPGSSTPFAIVVTAPNGAQKTYFVTVNRAALGGNNNLQSLTVTSGTLSPSFDANQQNYSVDVGSNVSSVTVTAQPQDGSATVTINGQSGTSRSVTLGAAGSSTSISIIVTAPNGSQKPYLVTVNRAAVVLSGNNNLSALAVSAGTLMPAFDAGTASYNVSAPNTVAVTTVTATVADSATATMTINGAPANSGVAFGPIMLSEGANPINIIVTAQNGMQKPYTVTVTRAAP
ncbi:hypothetical protein YTPLAS18_33420 [Nitrospira sp.]|nr:hypothetical protein YTPLAS18_33420 [Nitrospira sp.]